MYEKIFRVSASGLRLRVQPSTNSEILALLANGQAVARLDGTDHQGWWLVFADVPGDGLFVGYVFAQHLSPVAALFEPIETPAPPPDPPRDAPVADDPAREPDDVAGAPPSAVMGRGAELENGWHPSVPAEHRHANGNASARQAGLVDRVIIHVTGTKSVEAVVNRFTTPGGGASAHYLITPDGGLHQFVPEHKRAWHSGIKSFVRDVYNRGDGSWRRYKRYFAGNWARHHYPDGSIFLDSEGREIGTEPNAQAALVLPRGGGEWPEYGYFDQAWGRRPLPIGYAHSAHNPNDTSIGVELLSFGSVSADPAQYPNAMYATLAALVDDICLRYGVPKTRETICGHEDVNPVERWGWDPNRGFDWDRVLTAGGLG